MDTKIEKVEAVSLANSGVKLAGKWFTVVGKAANYLDQIQAGDRVEIGEFQGKISFVKKVNGNDHAPDCSGPPMLAGQGKDNSFTPPKYIERMATALERLAVAVERLALEKEKP
jgi:hypothetical protein